MPLLAVLGLRARHMVWFTSLQFVFHLPVVLRLLGTTVDFVPPVQPQLTPRRTRGWGL